MTDHVALQSRIDAQAKVIRCLECEIEQLKRGLRVTREQLEDATIELECLRRAPTIPATPLASDSCLPAVESRGDGGA